MEYFSIVTKFQLQDNIRNQISNDIKQFEGKRVRIVIEKLKSKRSHQQNSYWWALITILSCDIGYTKEEIHQICKYKFLKREKVNEKTGEIYEYLTSTTKLNKSEFSEMTSELIRWAAEAFNIILPIPGEQLTIDE